jgi:predicted glycosyl hydrolase (DUF1957 family)
MKINIDKDYNNKYTNLLIEKHDILESIVLKNNITAHSRLIYIYMFNTIDKATTIENLSKKFNKTKYTILTYFAELKNSKLIEIIKTNNNEFTVNLLIPGEVLEEYKTIDEMIKEVDKKYFEF